jgi:ubiquinone/menaquinone biosynthesis C-methylase UbiE
VLEHLDDDRPLIKEMFRVCKPGGYVLITIPVFEFMWSYHDTALHHKRRYTKQQVLTRIDGLPWDVRKCSYYNTLFFFPMLATRSLKRLLSKNRLPRSDFFMRLPAWLNRAMSLLFVSEISLLRYLNLPFGVSLILALQKTDGIDLKQD